MPDINKAYTWAIQTCDAPNIEYSIPNRLKTINGITYYDCSSFIWKALSIGGFDVESVFSTSGEKSALEGAGFVQVPKSDPWLPGDVLLRTPAFTGKKYGHTEMVYQGGNGSGVIMGAHGRSNRAPADQVSILTNDISYASEWEYLFRYGNGATGAYGYSPYAIAALCGNCWQESTMNPILQEVGGTGIGLFQWYLGRRTSFLNWMDEQGYELSNGNAQLEYLVYEDVWTHKTAYPEFNSLSDFLNTTITDIDYLTEAFMRCWEIPAEATANLSYRKQRAHECFEYFQNHANDTSITEWKTSNGYLGETGGFNNAVLIYRYMTAGGGGGSTPTEDTTHEVFSQSNKGIVYSAIGRRREVIVQWR